MKPTTNSGTKDKYNINEDYYFIGYVVERNQDLYNILQKSGFLVVFKEHNENLKGKKKGNVDTDMVFSIMKEIINKEDLDKPEINFDKIVLVSGDGDYKKLVNFLIERGIFRKILFPNSEFASSLYKSLGSEFFDYLDNPMIKKKIEFLIKKRLLRH